MSDISNGDFPQPTSRLEEYLQVIVQNQASNAKNGVTFTPSVSSEGVISWTNDGGLDNPESVNIMGPKGDTGATGPAGAKGDKGDTGATISAINFTKDSTGVITGGTATLSDNTSIAITITSAET